MIGSWLYMIGTLPIALVGVLYQMLIVVPFTTGRQVGDDKVKAILSNYVRK